MSDRAFGAFWILVILFILALGVVIIVRSQQPPVPGQINSDHTYSAQHQQLMDEIVALHKDVYLLQTQVARIDKR